MAFFPSDPTIAAGFTADRNNMSAQDIARIQTQAAIQQEQLRARTQQAALQQQYFQQQQQNQLAQQAQAENAFFNRGRLGNEQARIAADSELARAQMASGDARFNREDDTRRYLGNLTSGFKIAPELAAQTEMADAAKNLAEIMNQKEDLTKQLEQIGTVKSAADKLSPGKNFFINSMAASPIYGAYDYFKNNDSRVNSVLSKLPKTVPVDPNLDVNQNIENATRVLQGKIQELDALALPGVRSGLGQHITRQDGKFVSTLRPPVGSALGVPVGTTTQTNAPAGQFFNRAATATGSGQAAMAIPVPNDKSLLQSGQVYQTIRGPAVWDGTQFVQ